MSLCGVTIVSVVLAYVTIDRLMADRKSSSKTQSPGDLFRAPFLRQIGAQSSLNTRSELSRLASLAAPGHCQTVCSSRSISPQADVTLQLSADGGLVDVCDLSYSGLSASFLLKSVDHISLFTGQLSVGHVPLLS